MYEIYHYYYFHNIILSTIIKKWCYYYYHVHLFIYIYSVYIYIVYIYIYIVYIYIYCVYICVYIYTYVTCIYTCAYGILKIHRSTGPTSVRSVSLPPTWQRNSHDPKDPIFGPEKMGTSGKKQWKTMEKTWEEHRKNHEISENH